VAWVVRTALNANNSRWPRRRREVSLPDPGTVKEHLARALASLRDELVTTPQQETPS
jgi:hypothetical protein